MAQQLVRVNEARSADFEQAWEIYEEALPSGERKPRAAIEAVPEREDYRLFVLRDSGRVVSFAIIFVSPEEPFALLEYMASHKDWRGRGAGGALFRLLVAEIGKRTLLAEVDSDREAGSDRTMRARRKSFYRRLGCRQVEGLDYLMPVVADTAPPRMDLMLCPPGDALPLKRARLRAWLEEVYAAVYGQALPDPRIDSMMAGVADPVTLAGGNAIGN